MSVRVQSRVWEYSRATGSAFVVLLKIADNCDDDGCNAWPSVTTLARYCRCSESTVQRALRELEALGELEVAQQMGGPRAGSRYATNLYRVLLEGCQIDTPELSPGVSNPSPRGVKNGDSGVSPVTPNSPLDPSKNTEPVDNERLAAQIELCRTALQPESSIDPTRGDTP
jgi:DNA-binding transcriptional MocR family regulator